MAKEQSLEQLTIHSLDRYNRITLKERMAHLGRWAWQNKPIVVVSGLLSWAAYKSLSGMYHDFFVADSSILEYLELVKGSIDSLAKSLGEIMVQSTAEDKTVAVNNHYLELLTNMKFAAEHASESELTEMVNTLTQDSGLFSGTAPGKDGLIKINEFRPVINEIIGQYKFKGAWMMYLLVVLVGSTIVPKVFSQIHNPDEDYKERKDIANAVDERIKHHLPNLFEKLKEVPQRDLIYKLTITYTRQTRDPESALSFLFMAKEEPDIISRNFEKTFGINDFNPPQMVDGDVSIDELIKFVDANIENFEANGFDYGLMKFDSIGGYEDIKEELKLYASIFADMDKATHQGVEGMTGVILEGPPGCGKTLLAEAFINETLKSYGHKKRTHYKIVSGADLKSMWYSKSEKNIQRLYKEARRKAPYIIFIDEGEELFSKRGYGHEADTAGTNQLLTEIGGIKRTDRVLTIITTNRADTIDEAAKRYGRLGIHFSIDIPNEAGRKEIAKIHLGRLGRQELVDKFDYELFAKETDGTTGADIAGIISKTFWERYRSIKAKGKEPYQLTTNDFLAIAQSYGKTVEKLGFGKN